MTHPSGPFTESELNAAIYAAIDRLAETSKKWLPRAFKELADGLPIKLRGQTFRIGYKPGELFERIARRVAQSERAAALYDDYDDD